MSETFKNESKDISSNTNTNKNKIYDSLISPFSSDKGIKIKLSDFNPKVHYSYKDIIFDKSYEYEDIIEIILDKEIIQNYELKEEEISIGNSPFNHIVNLPFLFYFDLLITDKPNIINYSYSYQLIDIINQYFLKNNNEFYLKVIKSKIIIDLIRNYRGTSEYKEFRDKNNLFKIEDENIKIFESNAEILKLGYTSKEIYRKKIDQIYADIIKSQITQDNFYNCQNIEEMLIKLGLDKIDITQTMIKYFSQILTGNNKYLNKYKIDSIFNFSNANTINFYYILLKYLFNSSNIKEEIPFLLNTKKSILGSKNDYLNGQSSIKFDEKSKYVLESILDSPNDSEMILNFCKEELANPQVNEYDKKDNNSNYEIYGTSSENTVIEFVKSIKGEIVEQLSDGNILCSIGTKINIYDQSFNFKSDLSFDDLTYIREINIKSSEKDTTQFVAYSKQQLTIFKLKNNIIHKTTKKNYCCSFYLDIKENLKIISGECGTKFLDGEFNEINDYENDKLKNKSFRSGIKIDQNIIALASRDLDVAGENKLLFYNFNSKKIVDEISGYSFAQYPKSLELFPKDKPRMLMCCCEKVNNKKQNGILFINLDILKKTDSEIKKIKNNNKEEYLFFYNSENFKANCFCLLLTQQHIINNSSNLLQEYNIYEPYFLAAGEEKKAGRSFGKIVLFQVQFNNSNFNLVIERNAIDYEIIDKSITSMILTTKNENLLATNGNEVYIFKKPNLNGYLSINDYFNYSTT